jgi:hypothetical protein
MIELLRPGSGAPVKSRPTVWLVGHAVKQRIRASNAGSECANFGVQQLLIASHRFPTMKTKPRLFP